MTKRNIGIVAIIISAIIFFCLLVWQLLRAISIVTNPDTFTLLPFIWVFAILILLLGHIGLYVMIMDYKDKTTTVWADTNWWEAWDET